MDKPIALNHLDEFKQILSNYHVADTSSQVLKKINLLLLSAPTATGANTIINQLLKTGNYYYIVSDTTRPPKFRDGAMEQNGVQYFFRSELEILRELKEGKYLEAAVIHNQQVSGISLRELEKALVLENIAITEVEVQGSATIYHAKPDSICVFMLPPSFDEWQRRIRTRESMNETELKNRLSSALGQIIAALENDYFKLVINDKLEDAMTQINELAHYGYQDENVQQNARNLAERLYIETEAFLGKS